MPPTKLSPSWETSGSVELGSAWLCGHGVKAKVQRSTGARNRPGWDLATDDFWEWLKWFSRKTFQLSTHKPRVTSECYKHIRESLLCGSFSLLESRKTDAEIFVDSSTRKASKSWGQPRIKPLGLHGTVPSIPLGKRHAGHQPAMQGHLVKGIVTPYKVPSSRATKDFWETTWQIR